MKSLPSRLIMLISHLLLSFCSCMMAKNLVRKTRILFEFLKTCYMSDRSSRVQLSAWNAKLGSDAIPCGKLRLCYVVGWE